MSHVPIPRRPVMPPVVLPGFPLPRPPAQHEPQPAMSAWQQVVTVVVLMLAGVGLYVVLSLVADVIYDVTASTISVVQSQVVPGSPPLLPLDVPAGVSSHVRDAG